MSMYTAIECAEFGPVEQLRVVERESPPLGAGAVRIAVSACGVNFVDGLLAEGRYQIRPPLPFVPGMEVVGRIVEIGDDVLADALADGSRSFALGDRVFANVGFGGFASEAIVSGRQVISVTESLTDGQAATFMQSYMTGWFAICERAGIVKGECDGKTMLVLGAGSGVGLAAVDIASSMGLQVIAAASTEEKRALAVDIGATATIDSSALDATGVKDAAKAWAGALPEAADRATGRAADRAAGRAARSVDRTAPRDGVDYLYDPVGGELGETCLRALGEDGQYLVIGFVAGIPRLPANQVLLRNRRVTGVDWGAWAGRNPAANQAMLVDVIDAIDRGDLHPVEPTTYPLRDASRALADLASRKVAGKVALVP